MANLASFLVQTGFIQTIAAGAAVYVVLAIIYSYLSCQRDQIPSAHWSAPISRLWILRRRALGNVNAALLEAHRRLGPVVRLGPDEISIASIDGVRAVYGGAFEKHAWYNVFDNFGIPNMFSTSSNGAHSARKRILSHLYSKSTLHASTSLALSARQIIHHRFLSLVTVPPTGVELHSLLHAAAMDLIAAYVVGADSTDFLRRDATRNHWLELYRTRGQHGFWPQEMPVLTTWAKRAGWWLYPDWVDNVNAELEEWCLELVRPRVERAWAVAAGKEKEDDDAAGVSIGVVLAALVRELSPQKPHSEAHAETDLRTIASEVMDHLLAGHETTGIALTYAMWELSKDQESQAVLRSELLAVVGTNHPSGTVKTIPADPRALDALPALHAVTMETLRLYAPIPGAQPRVAPPAGCVLSGFRVPCGTRISAAAHVLHRDPSIFVAEESWQWRRWLGDEDNDTPSDQRHQKKRDMNRQFWAFGSGGRMCVGSNFAMYEMKLIIAAVYSNFSTHVVDDQGMEQMGNYTARPAAERLYLRFEKL